MENEKISVKDINDFSNMQMGNWQKLGKRFSQAIKSTRCTFYCTEAIPQ